MAFVRCARTHTDDLYVASVAGGPARRLARDVDLPDDWGPHSWSGDSTSVLVTGAAGERVLVIDVRRRRRRTIPLGPGVRLNGATFSPDAASVLLDEIDAGGQGDRFALGERLLPAFGEMARLPVWGAGGLADAEGATSVQLRSSPAGQPRVLYRGEVGANLAPLAWSADGRVLLVVSTTLSLGPGQSGVPAFRAILVTRSTGAAAAIAGYTGFYDVSGDGKSVLAQRARDVVSVTAAGVATTLATSARSASWSQRG